MLRKPFGPITRSLSGLGFGFPMADTPAGSTSSGGCPVLEAWKALPGVVERVVKAGRICHVGKNGVDRQCVIDNADLIEPIINTHGALTDITSARSFSP